MRAANSIPAAGQTIGGDGDGFIIQEDPRPVFRRDPRAFILLGIGGGRRLSSTGQGRYHGHVLRGLIRRGESGPGGAARREKSRKRFPRLEGDQHGSLRPRGGHGGKDGGSAHTGWNLSGNGQVSGGGTDEEDNALVLGGQRPLFFRMFAAGFAAAYGLMRKREWHNVKGGAYARARGADAEDRRKSFHVASE